MSEAETVKAKVIPVDEAAVWAAVRRMEVWICALFGLALVALLAVFSLWKVEGSEPLLRQAIEGLAGTWFALCGLVFLIAPFCLRGTEILLGDDFLAGPDCVTDPVDLFLRRWRGMTRLAYRDIKRVNLDVARGRVTGAVVIGKDGLVIFVRRVVDPIAVVRAIRAHAGSAVTWRRSFPHPANLSANEVDTLIGEQAAASSP